MEAEARRTFIDQYATVRHAEGRGSDNPEYYRQLPFHDISGANESQWRIRACSYRCFEQAIVEPAGHLAGRPLRILDLGAGNGWMSHRLTLLGHESVALDIFTDPKDGLGAIHQYEVPVRGVAAEFDCLPFASSAFDLVVFNSSLHYSPDYQRTLLEARRCLRPSGQVIIIDSPVYEKPDEGERMVAERQVWFKKTYGFPSDVLRSIEYLDEQMLTVLATNLGIVWTRHQPWYGWRWALRPVVAKLKRRRPPSRFMILAARFTKK